MTNHNFRKKRKRIMTVKVTLAIISFPNFVLRYREAKLENKSFETIIPTEGLLRVGGTIFSKEEQATSYPVPMFSPENTQTCNMIRLGRLYLEANMYAHICI